MAVNQIPLADRLDRIRRGYAGDPAFVPCAIQIMADTLLSTYMASFPAEWEQLRNLLGIAKEEENALTYAQTAARINKLFYKREAWGEIAEAINLLAMPVQKCYEERKWAYDKASKNPA